ncbi:MAG: protein kinase [Ruminococcus sp.]|nr:protein kinase [Ruminococcus sp.]
MDIKELCINCFKPTGGEEVCMNCGFVQKDKPRQLSHLYPHTVIGGRYVIGTVINNGGLAVVYKAYDLKLETVVAIKELFPTQNSIVSRVPGTLNVLPVNEEREQQFINIKQKFIAEAQTIAGFTNCGSIVHIYNIFEENNTAYIVMEYLEGVTLRKFLENNENILDFDTAMSIMLPVMEALKAVHNKGIVYRDVTPDNIFICDDNRVKLIDFSSACFSNKEKTYDNNEITKSPGFTPPELYRTNGKAGEYTDIYSAGAVLYSLVTGKIPEESTSRQEKDKLESPGKQGVKLPSYADKSIMKAMALREGARFKHMDDFIRAVQGKKKANYPEIELRKRKIRRAVLIVLIFLVLISSVVIAFQLKNNTILIPSKETTIELWYKSSGNVQKEYRWKTGDTSVHKGFSEYAKKQESPKITLITKGIDSKEYDEKLKEALDSGNGPDIYQSEGSKFDSYSMPLNNVYDLIKENEYNDVFDVMKNTLYPKNKIAFYYDTPIVFSRKEGKIPETLKKLNEDKGAYKTSLVCNPDSFLYTMNVYNNAPNALSVLSTGYDNYAKAYNDNNFKNVKNNFTKKNDENSVNHYIGMASDLPELTELRNINSGETLDIPFGISALPGNDAEKKVVFPETFSISNKSDNDEKKSAQLLFAYLMNYKNDEGQSRLSLSTIKVTTSYTSQEFEKNGDQKVETNEYKKIVPVYMPFTISKNQESSFKPLEPIYSSQGKAGTTSYDKLDNELKKKDSLISAITGGKYLERELSELLKK